MGKLRSSQKDKTGEVSRQSEMLKKLQEALTKSHVDLDETRRKADEDVSVEMSSVWDCLANIGLFRSGYIIGVGEGSRRKVEG